MRSSNQIMLGVQSNPGPPGAIWLVELTQQFDLGLDAWCFGDVAISRRRDWAICLPSRDYRYFHQSILIFLSCYPNGTKDE